MRAVNKHSRWSWQILTNSDSSVGAGCDRFWQSVNLQLVLELTDFDKVWIFRRWIWQILSFILSFMISLVKEFMMAGIVKVVWGEDVCADVVVDVCVLSFMISLVMSLMISLMVIYFCHWWFHLWISWGTSLVISLMVKVDWGCGVVMWGVCAGGSVLSES